MGSNTYCVILPYLLAMKYPNTPKIPPSIIWLSAQKAFQGEAELYWGSSKGWEGIAHPSAGPGASGETSSTGGTAGDGFRGKEAAREGEPIPREGHSLHINSSQGHSRESSRVCWSLGPGIPQS